MKKQTWVIEVVDRDSGVAFEKYHVEATRAGVIKLAEGRNSDKLWAHAYPLI